MFTVVVHYKEAADTLRLKHLGTPRTDDRLLTGELPFAVVAHYKEAAITLRLKHLGTPRAGSTVLLEGSPGFRLLSPGSSPVHSHTPCAFAPRLITFHQNYCRVIFCRVA